MPDPVEVTENLLPPRIPWNKGKLIGPKPPLRPKHVWSIRTRLQVEGWRGRTRDLAMFNLAIDSKLRGCDVVAIKVEDVAPHGYAADRATVRQRKTGRQVRFELTEQTWQAIDDYIRMAGKKVGEFLFVGRRGQGQCMTTRQYARLVSEWMSSIGLDPLLFGTHSLRRTKATLIYRRTGNLRAVQILLGHTKIESTVRYLGIEVDDALAIAEQIDIWPTEQSWAAALPVTRLKRAKEPVNAQEEADPRRGLSEPHYARRQRRHHRERRPNNPEDAADNWPQIKTMTDRDSSTCSTALWLRSSGLMMPERLCPRFRAEDFAAITARAYCAR